MVHISNFKKFKVESKELLGVFRGMLLKKIEEIKKNNIAFEVFFVTTKYSRYQVTYSYRFGIEVLKTSSYNGQKYKFRRWKFKSFDGLLSFFEKRRVLWVE